MTLFRLFRDIAVNRILALLSLFAAAVLFSGCTHPLQPYDQGRAMLQRSHGLLADGDASLAAARFRDAADLYAQADTQARAAVTCFLKSEQQIEDASRSLDAAPRDLTADRYHADSLRAYRESLALAVIMRSLATARTAEAWYRQGAEYVAAGDQFYRARQFASAAQSYDDAKAAFRPALGLWDDAAAFINSQMIGGSRLAAAAPHGAWSEMKDLQVLLDRRRNQTESYLSALNERAALAARIVDAYHVRPAGNLPALVPQSLPDLPDIVRYSVTHPPVPAAALVP
jgi:hypothetical protein